MTELAIMPSAAPGGRVRRRAKAAPEINVSLVAQQATRATQFLKTLANQHRLMILCHLVEGERSVTALEQQLGIQQAHLSQQLARLRHEGLVRTRRESRTIYYSLGSEETKAVLEVLYRVFCPIPD